ncbi:MAG: outer membrane beta-barrel protein [Puia sp.]|nr:outer membrane beta-barrel protein [Puia sp.]
MFRQFLLLAGLCMGLSGWAQNDTTRTGTAKTDPDTLRIGNLIIVRNGKGASDGKQGGADTGRQITPIHRHHRDYKPSNVSTNWIILDLGFANYNDRTNYSSAAAQQFAPGSSADWFHLRNGKSIDVNIWFFMQKRNLIKHVLNLKYGLGLELNNYRYTSDIKFLKDPTEVIMDTIHFSKNKLATDYLTVPVMLNVNFTPHRREAIGLSLGASIGYLYSSRQKVKSHQTGKQKTFDDFDLYPWKISYIGELQLGPVRLYGSYATKSIFDRGLNQTPYTVGIRFSNW